MESWSLIQCASASTVKNASIWKQKIVNSVGEDIDTTMGGTALTIFVTGFVQIKELRNIEQF